MRRLASLPAAASLVAASLAACGPDPAPTAPRPNPTPMAPVSGAAPPVSAGATPIALGGKGADRLATTRPKGAPTLGPEGPSTARSTTPSVYLANHTARREALEARLASTPADPGARPALASWHIEQMALDGDLEHAVTAERLLTDQLGPEPSDPSLLGRRASVRGHLHRFQEARADLERALAQKPGDPEIRRALAGVLENLGLAGEAAAQREGLAPEEDFQGLGQAALAHYLAGRIQAADHTLRRAHGAYADVHPGALAWIDLHRGHLRLRTGRWEAARAFFRAAYERLPQNFVVAEHLAEVEALLGNHPEALRIYDEVVAATRLPEFMAARAGVLTALGRTEEARAAITAADQGWKALLERYPTALAAHAIDFWLEDKLDPALAHHWAEKNLEVRRDPESLLRAVRARVAVGKLDAARALLPELSAPPLTDEFQLGLAAALEATGDPQGAAQARARARALNPKAE